MKKAQEMSLKEAEDKKRREDINREVEARMRQQKRNAKRRKSDRDLSSESEEESNESDERMMSVNGRTVWKEFVKNFGGKYVP